MSNSNDAPRVRQATDIDFSKAKPHCKHCHGTGTSGYRTVTVQGETARVRVVCRCVTQNDGVRRDAVDELLEQIQHQLDTGAFGANLAADIRRLPAEHQPAAIENVRAQMTRIGTPDQVRDALRDCLVALGEEESP